MSRSGEVAVRGLPAALVVLALSSGLSAHRLDEYLQAALVAIAPGELTLSLNLTPGMKVAERVIALIDRNRDDVISPREGAMYAASVKRDLDLRLDRRPLDLTLIASEFPPPVELRTGAGIIRLAFTAPLQHLESGAHTVAFENRHQRGIGAYLLNAARPASDAVRITRQNRHDTQSRGNIEFIFRTGDGLR